MKSTVLARYGYKPRPQGQVLQAYKPMVSSSTSTATDHVFFLSAEDVDTFFSACDNPPAATDEMHHLAKEVAEWFK